MKILVTGSEGFIGSHLVESMVRKGYKVRCFILYNSFNSNGWLEKLPKNIKKKIEYFYGDIRDRNSVIKAVKGCHKVVNLASLIAIPYSYEAPFSYIETNIVGTTNLLQVSLEQKIKKFVQISTSEVYGSAIKIPMSENHPLNAQSPYAATKIGADQMALSFHKSFNLPVVVIRPFNTFGPRQSERAIIPTIIAQAMKKNSINIGSVFPKRDFTYVSDTCEGIIKALNNNNKNIFGQTINLGSNYSISINQLIKKISKILKKKIIIKKDKKRVRPKKSEVDQLLCDNKKAKKILKWKPKYSGLKGLDNGLKKTIQWFGDEENLNSYNAKKYIL